MRYNDTSCQDFLQGTMQGVSPPHLRMVLDAAVVACLAQQARGQQTAADVVPASADSGDGVPASADSGDADAVPAGADAAAGPASGGSRNGVPASINSGDAATVAQQSRAQQAAACPAAGEKAEQQTPAVLDAAADAPAAVAQESSAGDGQWQSVFQRSMRDALDSSWTKKGLRVSKRCCIEPCSDYVAPISLDGLLVTAPASACSIQVAERLAVQRQDVPSHLFCVLVSTPRACSQQVRPVPPLTLRCATWGMGWASLGQT